MTNGGINLIALAKSPECLIDQMFLSNLNGLLPLQQVSCDKFVGNKFGRRNVVKAVRSTEPQEEASHNNILKERRLGEECSDEARRGKSKAFDQSRFLPLRGSGHTQSVHFARGAGSGHSGHPWLSPCGRSKGRLNLLQAN